MEFFCECNNLECDKTVNLSLREAEEVLSSELTLIADGCPTGPEPTDELVEKRDGYKLYREGKND